MKYFSENLNPAAMITASTRVAIPGGRESGDVSVWLEEQGLDTPVFNGRCLHFKNK